MAEKLSKIGKNIRKIRSVKKLSQSEFAELFNLSRTSVGAYEEGRAEPKINMLIAIANHFGISIDDLLNKELTVNELYKFDIFNRKDKSADTPSTESIVFGGTIPLVSKEDAIKYLDNHNDSDYILRLPSIFLPLRKKSSLRAFAMNSNGMQYDNAGIFQDDIVIGRRIKDILPKHVHVDEVYIIITYEKITIRRLINKRDGLVFKGDNENYDPVEIPIEHIQEIWQVEGYYTYNLKSPLPLEQRVKRLEEQVLNLSEQISKSQDTV